MNVLLNMNENYNKLDGFPDYGYNIIYHLILNNENLWKLIKYNDPKALSKPNLTTDEKVAMIFKGDGNSEEFNVFRQPFIDDAFTMQTTQLRVFTATIIPNDSSKCTIDYAIECITHIKLDSLDNGQSRTERMIYEVIRTLNGADIGGVGTMFFDIRSAGFDGVRADKFNNRYFYGYTIIMSVRNGSVQ